MSVLYLTEEDVRELLDMETAIEVVEEAFRQLGQGRAENVPRGRAKADGVMLHTMCAAAEYLQMAAWKCYTTTADGPRFHVGLYDATGRMQALIEADFLGQLRTGAASGVATEYMARPDAKVVGLFGAGVQARTQLKAVCTVRRIERVEVYCRDGDGRHDFADEIAEYCAVEVIPVAIPDEVAAEKDIIITATTSRTPVFDGKVIEEGTHLNVIGSNFRNKAEIDVDTVRRADVIVCDSIEQCKAEAGDFSLSLEEGITDWRLMHELSDVVLGKDTGRPLPESITLFKSVGLALEDLAVGAKVLELAREARLGIELPIGGNM